MMRWLVVGVAALSFLQDKKEPEFMLGWYTGLDPQRLSNFTDCNFAMPYTGKNAGNDAKIQAYLDAAQKQGVKVFLEPDREWLKQSDWKSLRAWTKKWKDHPAVYGWYSYDEPELAQNPAMPPEKMADAYRAIKETDPAKPVGVVFNNLGTTDKYAPGLDILMWDDYPCLAKAPEFKGLKSWTKRLDTASRKAQTLGKKGLIVAVQGYGKSHPQYGKRDPTAAEERYMLYVSIVTENCLGVLVFMDSWADDDNKKIILPLMKEIHDIGFSEIAKGKTVACGNPAIRARRCGKTLVAVNTTPEEQKGATLDGRTLDFGPYQVHLIR